MTFAFNKIPRVVFSTLLLAGMVACGGGGGGGGLPSGPLSMTPPSTSSPPGPDGSTNAQPLKLEVKINGQAMGPVIQGSLLGVTAGDALEISSDQDVTWEETSNPVSNQASSAGARPDVVTATNVKVSSKKWAGQIVSPEKATGYYAITAKTTGSSIAKKIGLELLVNAEDERNGDYQVFATNGEKLTLKLDFNRKTYKMRDNAGLSESGSFNPDASVKDAHDTYIFSTSRVSGSTNTARFRVSLVTDFTVVGTFPFAMPGGAYAVRPFVASRTPIKSPDEIDGNYNGFGTSMAAMIPDSSFNSLRISNHGTQLDLCTDDVIYSVGSCPPASLKSYSVSKGATDGAWRAVNKSDPTDIHNFSVVRIDNDKVYLEADKFSSNAFMFRIGLPDGGNPGSSHEMFAYGGATDGSWGLSAMNPVGSTLFDYSLARQSSPGPAVPGGERFRGYTRSYTNLSGPESSMSAIVGSFAVIGPPLPAVIPFALNVRYAVASPVSYLMARSEKVFVRVGPRVPATSGYLEIGLIKP